MKKNRKQSVQEPLSKNDAMFGLVGMVEAPDAVGLAEQKYGVNVNKNFNRFSWHGVIFQQIFNKNLQLN